MGKEFRQKVYGPLRATEKLRKKIEATSPEKKLGKVARGVGLTGAWGVQFLMWLTTKGLADNRVLRSLEKTLAEIKNLKTKDGKNRKLNQWMKRNPNFSAHIMYYLLMGALIGGGALATNYDKTDKKDSRKKVRADAQKLKLSTATYGEYKDAIGVITPWLIADLIAKEGVKMKNGMHVPYLDSEGVWTIGNGSTMLKDGTSVTQNTRPITTAEAYELSQWHLETETYFLMYCYAVGANLDFSDIQTAFGIGSTMYNAGSKLMENPNDDNHKDRFTKLREDLKKYGNELTAEQVKKRFEEYPIVAARTFGGALFSGKSASGSAKELRNFLRGGDGMRWRRWLEAGVLTGKVTPQMLLDCPLNGMFEFFNIVGRDKANWFVGDDINYETYNLFYEWLKNPVDQNGHSLKNWKRVSDMLPAPVAEMCRNENCGVGAAVRYDAPDIERKTYAIGYDDLYADAIAEYRDGNYKSAAKKFEDMAQKYPKNALLHNDLATTYNELGKYEKAIEQARIVLDMKDVTQYGAALYNAGVAYEAIGNIERALLNYRQAVKHGNRVAQKEVTRLEKNVSKKTVAFSKGTNKLKKSADARGRRVAGVRLVKNVRSNA